MRNCSDCRGALEDQYCALFEEHKHYWFVDALLCGLEYDAFYAWMLGHARAAGAAAGAARDGGARK
jgi:hypothetical protein